MRSMRKVWSDSEPADIDNPDSIFHIVFDLNDRYRVPGAWGLYGSGYQNDGSVPYWRAIRDDKERIIAAITPNSDLGDSWEHADNPEYPEKYSALGDSFGSELRYVRDDFTSTSFRQSFERYTRRTRPRQELGHAGLKCTVLVCHSQRGDRL